MGKSELVVRSALWIPCPKMLLSTEHLQVLIGSYFYSILFQSLPIRWLAKKFVYAELRTRSYKSQRARTAVDCNCDHCICGMRLPAITCSQRTSCELFDFISSYLIDRILFYDKLSRISWIFNKYFSQLMNIICKLINIYVLHVYYSGLETIGSWMPQKYDNDKSRRNKTV